MNTQRQKNSRSSDPSRSSGHVRLLVDDQYPGNPFVEFESELASLGLEAQTSHRKLMPLMSSQMLGLSALAIWITYPFFKAFLSEAGKDSYRAAKKLFVGLWKKVLRPGLPKGHVLTAEGIKSQEYSVTITISADFKHGRVTLLFPDDCNEEVYGKSVNLFMDMMLAYNRDEAFHGISLDEDENCFYGTILVTYDASCKTLRSVNPYSHLDDTKLRNIRAHEKNRRSK